MIGMVVPDYSTTPPGGKIIVISIILAVVSSIVSGIAYSITSNPIFYKVTTILPRFIPLLFMLLIFSIMVEQFGGLECGNSA